MAKAMKLRKRKVGTSKLKKLKKACDRLITEIFTGQPCEVCKSQGRIETFRTCGHHACNKSLSAYYRHVPKNIVVLCPKHHMFSNDIAPHSGNIRAIDAFVDWLKEHRPDAWHCIETYKLHTGDYLGIDFYEERLEILKKLKGE